MAKKILIIDDEPDILELVSDELKYEGFEVMVASSGNEAVEILKQHQFEAVVSDFKMPNGNGRVVLDFVKSIEASIRPLFYFVSGQADMSFEDALKEGVHHFFYKPFDIEELIASLKKG